MVKDKIIKIGKKIYWKYPVIQPFVAPIHRALFIKSKFSGWGMKTEAALPWNDEYCGEFFRKSSIDVKENFEFTKIPTHVDKKTVDALLWRHWVVSYAVRHAIEFAEGNNYNFVECGVGDGLTAFFTLREITNNIKTRKKSTMHLYDAWSVMRKEGLLESEINYAGRYSELDINRTRKNLAEFKEYVVYHQGYISESFYTLPESPTSIVYLSIDLNSMKPTLDVLNFFFPKLSRGGIILFDDYGQDGYVDTRKAVDKFFSGKPGILSKLPTSQAIYYR